MFFARYREALSSVEERFRFYISTARKEKEEFHAAQK